MADHRPPDENRSGAPSYVLRAEDGAAALRQVVRTMQHQINNSLSILMGQAQQLLLDPQATDSTPAVRTGLETIYHEGRRIAEVVKSISVAAGTGTEAAAAPASPAAGRRSGDAPGLASGFRALVEDLAQGAVVVDAGMVIRYANASFGEIVGRVSAELIGQPVDSVFEPGSAGIRAKAHLERAMSGRPGPVEIQLSRGLGETVWIQLECAPFRPRGTEVLGAFATVADITRQKQSEQDVREAALQDPLTGLPNRTLLLERMENALARSKRHRHHQFAVLFIDLDHLKWVNDGLGHPAGDAFLVEVAARLQASLRPEDTVARIGGDEFVILLEGIEETADATRIAERILSDISRPVQIQGYEATPSVSIGIVLSDGTYNLPEQLVRDADTAMYRAKAAGRGQYKIFDPNLHRVVSSRLRIEAELGRALERGEFRLHYQPIVALDTRRLVGLEALIRWEHPERGLLQPADFLAIAEQTSMILPIGQWVLSHACLRLRAWRARYRQHAPQWIAVNLSNRQFLQPGLGSQIREVLRQTSLAPEELRLDVQENTLSGNSQMASAVLSELRMLGVRVNLDNFGTGYSSISGLHAYPIDALKIDRSFLRDPELDGEQARLVRTILSMAESVGASAIAEGVSTNEQLVQLQWMGCALAQGFLFSRPLDREDVERLLRRDAGEEAKE